MSHAYDELVSALRRDLVDRHAEVRAHALRLLRDAYVECGDGGCRTNSAVAWVATPVVIEAMRSPSPESRISGARAVEVIAFDAADALATLATLLSDPVVDVRIAALEAFGECAARAKPYAHHISASAKYGDTQAERDSAMAALANITE